MSSKKSLIDLVRRIQDGPGPDMEEIREKRDYSRANQEKPGRGGRGAREQGSQSGLEENADESRSEKRVANEKLRDPDIREPLYVYLEEEFGKIRIIEEKTIGKSRADAMMVEESAITGIEIKSDADSFARLSRQIPDYDRSFDYNILVVGSHHALHAAEHVPDWWGIISAEWDGERMDFYRVRERKSNPKVRMLQKLRMLWRPELAHIQELNGVHAYRSRSKEFVIDKILQKVDPKLLDRQISEELFQRDYTTIEEDIRKYKQKLLK